MAAKTNKKGYLKMIVATDECCGMGLNNDLPWRCKEDLQMFKEKTTGTYIIMGHNTAKSLPNGKALPNRTNIVLCRELPEKPVTDFIYFHSVEDILEFVDGEDAWVIGGVEIYKLFIEDCEEIHETDIHGSYDCDTFLSVAAITSSFTWQTKIKNEFKGTLIDSLTIWSRKDVK